MPHIQETGVTYNNSPNTTASETLTGKVPDMNFLHKFFSVCCVYDQNAKKLDGKALKWIFVDCDKIRPSF